MNVTVIRLSLSGAWANEMEIGSLFKRQEVIDNLDVSFDKNLNGAH